MDERRLHEPINPAILLIIVPPWGFRPPTVVCVSRANLQLFVRPQVSATKSTMLVIKLLGLLGLFEEFRWLLKTKLLACLYYILYSHLTGLPNECVCYASKQPSEMYCTSKCHVLLCGCLLELAGCGPRENAHSGSQVPLR